MSVPSRLKIYSELMRIEKPIGTLLLLWPTLWAWLIASDGYPNWTIGLLLCLGTFFMRSAGCVVNDFADRNYDGHVERTKNRPFARKVVTSKEAFVLVICLTALSVLCLLPLNRLSWYLSVIAFFVAMSYPFSKRIFPLPQAYLGVAFSFGIPIAFAAQTNQLPLLAWLIFFANIAWTIAYDTIYAIADKEDDIQLNIYTSAITFGRYDIHWVMFFHGLFLLLLTIVGYQITAAWPYWLGLCWVFYLQIRQYQNIKSRDRGKCFETFLANNRIGVIIFMTLIAQYLWKLVL